MNSVSLIGRITKDPEVKYTSSQMAVARFTLAINRPIKDKDGNTQADFPSIIAFGKTAENMERYVSKGMLIGVTGRIQTGSYEKDGKTVYTTDVVADRVEFLSQKAQNQPADQNNSSGGGNTHRDAENAPMDGFSVLQEEIPF